MNELLMPRPREIRRGSTIRLTTAANTVVGDASARLRRAASWLPPMGLRLRFHVEASATSVPALADRYDYRLSFTATKGNGAGERRVEVTAATEWGALAALSTLAQLSADESLAITEIRDAPRFPWRGVMIDTVRHFISVAALKRTLDAMWFYKLNVLHLHLTDDQGFRFSSDVYPELSSSDAYSQAELRDLVAYAADRGVRVVPELDMPGHTASWLAAHPEWGKHGYVRGAPSTRFGVHKECLDPANAGALAAVHTLLAEVSEVFADEFVHFGGDEAVGVPAKEQAAFHRVVVAELAKLGKRAIGWDECLHPGLPAGTTVQAWRGADARDAVTEAGFDCVVSSPYYLDLFYPAQTHYAYDPAGDLRAADRSVLTDPRLRHVRDGMSSMADFGRFPKMPAEVAGHVLGGEACLWAELVTDELLDTRLWSRMPVIADRFWAAVATPSDDPYPRMAATRRTLCKLGIVELDRAVVDQYPDLAPLIEMLEPVKWYRRLLGEAGYKWRVAGRSTPPSRARPYDVTTPLTRIVDRIAPESLTSRQAEADLAAGADMSRWIAGWRRQRTALADHPQLAGELSTASDALARVADIVAHGPDATADAAALAGPFGEYLLPIAYAVGAAAEAATAHGQNAPVASTRKMSESAAEAALAAWPIAAAAVQPLAGGHINDTYVVGGRFILQRINRFVFRDPQAVMRNLAKAIAHEGGRRLIAPIATVDGADFAVDRAGDCWRLFPCLPSRSLQTLPDELLATAGEAFGGFLAAFSDFPGDLEPVIDGFHDLGHHLKRFDSASTCAGDAERREIDALRRHFRLDNELRVIHGDCKINNVLFHPYENAVVAVIDLDTVMFGHPAWDFGDLVRSAFVGDDEAKPAMALSLPRFERLCRGFFAAFGDADDVAGYAIAPAYMSFMLAVRFLTDHLEGDVYFKVARRGDNLLRARSQLALARQFRDSASQFRGAIEETLNCATRHRR